MQIDKYQRQKGRWLQAAHDFNTSKIHIIRGCKKGWDLQQFRELKNLQLFSKDFHWQKCVSMETTMAFEE